MAIDRRQMLGRIALGLGVLACRGAVAQPAERASYVAIETSAQTGRSRARFFAATGAETGFAPLDFRAHGMAQAGQTLVVFPRRPGTRFALVDMTTLDVRHIVDAPADRHFYGHGAVTLDGTHLLVTENDLTTLQGAIGVYDISGPPKRLGHIDLPGPGPHDIIRDPKRDQFYVALGGLETHPDYGRTPLNLSQFRSQIVSLSFARAVPDPYGHWGGSEGISLRHLAVGQQGQIYVGGQLVDPARGRKDHVLWRCDDAMAVALDGADGLGGYVSSITAHGAGTIATSKVSGRAMRLVNDRAVALFDIDGASAAAVGPDLQAVSGYGRLILNGANVPASTQHEFDNHGLVTVG